MAGRAVDIESLLAAIENGFGDWKWEFRDWVVTFFSGIEARVFVKMASGDSSGDQRTRSAAIVEEAAAGQRFVSRLIVHVLAAGGGEEYQDSPKQNCGAGYQPAPQKTAC